MARWFVTCFAVIAVLAAATPSPSANAALTTRMQGIYDAQCNDVVRGNFDAFSQTMSPKFTTSIQGETVTRDDVVLRLKAFAAQVHLTSCATQIESAQQVGNVVIAVVRQTITGTAHGSSVEIDGSKRDLWAENADGLAQTSSSVIWQSSYVNGKLARQTGTPPTPAPATSQSPGVTASPSGTPTASAMP
jgi:hypothetical protein